MKLDFMKADRKTLETAMDKVEEKNNKIEEIFSDERKEWGDELLPLFDILRRMDKNSMVDLQAETLSLRHRIQDKITYYMAKLSKSMPSHKSALADRFEFYATGYGIKTSAPEQRKFVDRDLAQRSRSIELLENHIEYLRECRYSCDQIQYAVKNVIGIAQYVA